MIQHAGGHARIIAVAGSGKTQTLTAYVHNRLQSGADPRRMLVLMYNKAAQLDFERRLKQVAGRGAVLPDVRTFHSLGYRICQTLVQRDYMAAFDKDILQDSDIEPVIWRILRNLADADIADDILTRKKKWVEPAVAYLELVKSSLATPEQVFESTGLPASCKLFIQAFYEFEDWRSQHHKMTFSDLLYEPVLRFKNEPDIAAQFAGHMAEYLVDEFQDINPVQEYLLKTLHGGKSDILVVGDPDQTIYEFRGSDPALLTTGFSNSYQGTSDYQLSHTFRFGDTLSLLANQVIAGNYAADSPRIQCVSHQSAGTTRVQREACGDSAQAALTCIRNWQASRPLKDIAVINRLWANSARLELLLLANAIPYHMDNQQTVLERYELRPFRVLLQIAAGETAQWDARARKQAWQVLLTQPYLKIKKSIVDELISRLAGVSREWGQALRNAIPNTVSKYQSEQLFERARWIEKAERAQGEASLVLYGWLQGTDYLASLKDNAFSVAQVEDQVATVKAFVSFVRQSRWPLAQGAAQLTELMNRKTPANADALLITSIHKSKGRQWPCVIIPELNSQFFPYQPEGEMMIATSVASERRLLYVAMTRAAEELVLLTPADDSTLMPSRFIPDAYVDGLAAFEAALGNGSAAPELPGDMHRPSVEFYARLKGLPVPAWQQRSLKKGEELVNQVVSHPKLGVGQIIAESKNRITIQFMRHGEREFDKQIVLPLLQRLNED
ncbi:DNA helicase-2/ATP-dependent DNA helicase PcrA [Reinekea marinisedimentorum]|uniref:DNA 3'-5' helicase n=1 Tax=Reinekea marinisedimentorum TaxID=230495 RepID=A0A4R3IGC8_9GAMM|nr:DNA helicase-2/ATP-dependent DNA helicase PcrA [Reinekea marinisedimentorum]